jgi:hypothetical protein
MPGAPTLKMRENQKKRKELLSKKKNKTTSRADLLKKRGENIKRAQETEGKNLKSLNPEQRLLNLKEKLIAQGKKELT